MSNFSSTSFTSAKSSSVSSKASSRADGLVVPGVPDEDGDSSGVDLFFEQQIDEPGQIHDVRVFIDPGPRPEQFFWKLEV